MAKMTFKYMPEPDTQRTAETWIGSTQGVTWNNKPTEGMRRYRFSVRRAGLGEEWKPYPIWCVSDEIYDELIKQLGIAAHYAYYIKGMSTVLQEDNGQLLMF